MSKPSLIKTAVVLLSVFLFPLSCAKKDDVDLILQVIEESRALAEQHDIKGLLKITSEDFRAMPGRLDRQGSKRILWGAFRHYGEFKILYPEPRIDYDGSAPAAKGRIYFMIVKKARSYPDLKDLYKDPEAWLEKVGSNADLYRLSLDFVKKNDDWLVKGALFEPFKGLGFSRCPSRNDTFDFALFQGLKPIQSRTFK